MQLTPRTVKPRTNKSEPWLLALPWIQLLLADSPSTGRAINRRYICVRSCHYPGRNAARTETPAVRDRPWCVRPRADREGMSCRPWPPRRRRSRVRLRARRQPARSPGQCGSHYPRQNCRSIDWQRTGDTEIGCLTKRAITYPIRPVRVGTVLLVLRSSGFCVRFTPLPVARIYVLASPRGGFRIQRWRRILCYVSLKFSMAMTTAG
jgi:hypothetical protein